MLSSEMSKSATSRTLNVMEKSGPEPMKEEARSTTPFVCVSPAERILLVMLKVMLVSVESGIEYENIPSYASPDFVVMLTVVP